jgi:hypothetical protein
MMPIFGGISNGHSTEESGHFLEISVSASKLVPASTAVQLSLTEVSAVISKKKKR